MLSRRSAAKQLKLRCCSFAPPARSVVFDPRIFSSFAALRCGSAPLGCSSADFQRNSQCLSGVRRGRAQCIVPPLPASFIGGERVARRPGEGDVSPCGLARQHCDSRASCSRVSAARRKIRWRVRALTRPHGHPLPAKKPAGRGGTWGTLARCRATSFLPQSPRNAVHWLRMAAVCGSQTRTITSGASSVPAVIAACRSRFSIQHSAFVPCTGRSTVNLAPRPVPSLAARIRPPWSSTRDRTIERPRPIPSCERVIVPSSWLNGSNA